MSYQVLARKWRPKNFSQVVGQQHVLTALSNSLKQNKVHHAYLFSGTRGVGKTTIARIFAKSLNCVKGVTSDPCGKCDNCISIDEGRFVDLLEIDAASRTKVEDTRELLDNVQYKPAIGAYKVYLVDEVHMLSKSSFNALLKTLEEPPEYVKFLLATTDPQKLPLTVLSRCLQFHLKSLHAQDIEDYLCLILQKEQASFEHTALAGIAKAANGSIRDALSLTDQALAFGAGNISHNDVLKMLGSIDDHHLQYLLYFIISGNVEKVFAKIEELTSLGVDFGRLHQDLAGLCHQIAQLQLQQSYKETDQDKIKMISECLSPEEVQLYYQIAMQGFKDYSYAPSGKIAFEMTVMRLLAFKPAAEIEIDEPIIMQNETYVADVVTTQNVEARKDINQPEHLIVADKKHEDIVFESPIEVESADQEKDRSSIKQPEDYNGLFYAPQVTGVDTCPAVPVDHDAKDAKDAKELMGASDIRRVKQAYVERGDENEANHVVNNASVASDPSVTHSRNILRQHREKRDQAKKGLATTEKEVGQVPLTVVAKQNIPQRDLKSATAPVILVQAKAPDEIKVDPRNLLVLNDLCMDSDLTGNRVTNNAIFTQEKHDNRIIALNYGTDEADFTITKGGKDNPAPLEVVKKNQLMQGEEIDKITHFLSPKFFISSANMSPLCAVPKMDIDKYVDDKLTDHWSMVIKQMQLNGLVKLLAKNCVMEQIDQQIKLTLKSVQKHLLSNPALGIELEQSLKSYFGQATSLYIEIGTIEGKLTALESERLIFDQCLNKAKKSLTEDENIILLVTSYNAKIYENSIIPL
ncbi:MAG: DNA polymerase III subunit gamma/tau [Psychromonas sp.]|nr:DNA polymerase III subunit gamma/tau [Psychromonas sp.]